MMGIPSHVGQQSGVDLVGKGTQKEDKKVGNRKILNKSVQRGKKSFLKISDGGDDIDPSFRKALVSR